MLLVIYMIVLISGTKLLSKLIHCVMRYWPLVVVFVVIVLMFIVHIITKAVDSLDLYP